MPCSKYHATAALLATAALSEFLPSISLLGPSQTSLGFAYDFSTPYEIPESLDLLLEERIRQVIREKREIQKLSMVPASAKGFLLSKNNASRREFLPSKGVLEIACLGNFADWVQEPLLKNSFDLKAFKILRVRRLKKHTYRLEGLGFASKEEMNSFLKEWKNFEKQLSICAQKYWYLLADEVVFRPKALQERKKILEILKEQLPEGVTEISTFSEESKEEVHQCLFESIPKQTGFFEVYAKTGKIFNEKSGLLEASGGLWCQLSLFDPSEEKPEKHTSSLQFVEKTLNILGISFKRKSLKNSIEWVFEDSLKREWLLWKCRKGDQGSFLEASIERLYAVLLYRS